MAAADCINYLQSQFDNYSIPLDGELLRWIRQSTEPPTQSARRIPGRCDERARYMVADLLEKRLSLDVACLVCNQTFSTSKLAIQKWHDSFDVSGIQLGSSGRTITCPLGHSLVSFTEKLY